MAFSRNIRVLVVDEHELVALSLGVVFESIEDIDLIGRAADGEQGVAMVGELEPDVVLMDLMMPVMDGFQATALIRARYPRVKVIVLSASTLQADVDAAYQAGAHAYLSKDGSGESIVDTIRSIVLT